MKFLSYQRVIKVNNQYSEFNFKTREIINGKFLIDMWESSCNAQID